MVRNRAILTIALLLLLGTGGVYWLVPSYLPGVGTNSRDGLQTVSEEEFAALLNESARRHQRRDHDHDSPTPDTAPHGTSSGETIPQDWTNRYNPETVEALESLKLVAETPAGDTNFVTRSLSGGTTALSDYRGNWRLLNFWATWCAPCREEMPAFRALQDQFSERNLRVIGMNVGESESTIADFASRYGLEFPLLLDQSGSIGSQYGTFTLPETWLITPSGEVLGVVRGPREWSEDPAVKFFERVTEE